MALLTGVILWRHNAQMTNVGWVEHTDQVIQNARQAQTDLLAMSVAIRSYLLVPDQKYLTALANAEGNLDASLQKISVLTADNPSQGRRLLRVSSLKGSWVGAIHTLVAQPNTRQPGALPLTHLDDQVQALSRVFDHIVDEEDRLLRQRTALQRSEDRLIV